MVILVLTFLLGIVVGLIASLIVKPPLIGNLVVDHSDLDGPYLFLEIEDHDWYKELCNHKKVTLRVVFKDYLPQK